MKAVIYARFSSDKQADGFSIEAQERACREYARNKGITILKSYVDEAKSGIGEKTFLRTEYKRMLQDTKKHTFDVILIHKYDRVARSLLEQVTLEKRLETEGIKLIAVAQDFGDTNEAMIARSITWAMAEYYSKNLSSEVRKGHKEKALKGQANGGTPPFGYDLDKETKKYRINELEAYYVRKMFACALNRDGWVDLIREMNAKGIRTNFIDARKMMVTNDSYLKGEPVVEEIVKRVPGIVAEAYAGMDAVITQGFISSNLKGEQTVLGRGGSDYSASLIGMAVDAERIEIWTDVDGVRTADPRRVPNTKYLEKISFEEAAEMAHFGAKVLHPLTIEPAVKKNIPLFVLNSMNPSGKGTAILRSELIEDGVKSVSFKENIRVINIFSMRMINTSGFLRRVFEIFSENKVSVDLISTSEANISVTVDASQKIDAVVEQLSEFSDVIVDDDKSQVSVIGKNIVRLNGMLKKTFTPLKKCNVYMISQGASFVNISFVVDREELDEVVLGLHDHLFDNPEDPLGW